jgi:hypothetical protein
MLLEILAQPYHEVDEGTELYFIHVTFQPRPETLTMLGHSRLFCCSEYANVFFDLVKDSN